MPVHHTVVLGYVNLDEPPSARPADAGPRPGLVHGAVGRANQPLPGTVKKAIQLEIHFHCNMGAPIQVGMHLTLKSNGKGMTTLPLIDHVKRNSFATVFQIRRLAKWNAGFSHGEINRWPSAIDANQQPNAPHEADEGH